MDKKFCKECGTLLNGEGNFCTKCGISFNDSEYVPEKLEVGMKYCKECGAQINSTAEFCSKCGTQQDITIANVPSKNEKDASGKRDDNSKLYMIVAITVVIVVVLVLIFTTGNNGGNNMESTNEQSVVATNNGSVEVFVMSYAASLDETIAYIDLQIKNNTDDFLVPEAKVNLKVMDKEGYRVQEITPEHYDYWNVDYSGNVIDTREYIEPNTTKIVRYAFEFTSEIDYEIVFEDAVLDAGHIVFPEE